MNIERELPARCSPVQAVAFYEKKGTYQTNLILQPKHVASILLTLCAVWFTVVVSFLVARSVP